MIDHGNFQFRPQGGEDGSMLGGGLGQSVWHFEDNISRASGNENWMHFSSKNFGKSTVNDKRLLSFEQRVKYSEDNRKINATKDALAPGTFFSFYMKKFWIVSEQKSKRSIDGDQPDNDQEMANAEKRSLDLRNLNFEEVEVRHSSAIKMYEREVMRSHEGTSTFKKDLELIPDELPLKKIMLDTSNGGMAIDKATTDYIYHYESALVNLYKTRRRWIKTLKIFLSKFKGICNGLSKILVTDVNIFCSLTQIAR